jgi:adenine-specific DNA-methyltransferase
LKTRLAKNTASKDFEKLEEKIKQMTTPIEKFQTLLRELFQFEHADLNFGVYRIMNLRRDRMERWLKADLPARAREILHGTGATFDEDLAQRLEGLKKQLQAVQHDAIDADGNLVALHTTEAGKEYARLFAQQRRAPVRTVADLEVLVYNHLYDFFSRYYDMGDFIPKRRRSFAPDGRDTYAVPWDGEEVVLHWANKDQYYIKTGDRFTHYRWQSSVSGQDYTVEFRLTEADLPANNNKEAKKKFHLPVADNITWDEPAKTLVIPFHYRGLTLEEETQIMGNQEAKIRENVTLRTIARLREFPTINNVPQLVTALMAPKRDADNEIVLDKDGNPVTLLRHHLNRWAMKNEADFFIHKNLRRFLIGELDYYLKSVVLNLDNLLAAGELRAESNFRLLEAVKKLGAEIIGFLAQLEDFQKALFEKRKFVVETHWCLTLDRIPAALKDEAYAAILANDRQWEEWEKLYNISKWPSDMITLKSRTRDFLDAFPYVMLDTSLGYEKTLVEKLLAGMENMDEQTNGLLIYSDNFQALNFLQERYREDVTSVYVDPPYNTDASAILYKNDYKNSSWLSLIENRLAVAYPLMSTAGVICFAIDDEEVAEARHILGRVFAKEVGIAVVRSNPQSRKAKGKFSPVHEYALFYGKSTDSMPGSLEVTEKRIARYPKQDDKGRFAWMNFIRTGSNDKRADRPKLYYPIFVDDKDNIRIPDMTWSSEDGAYILHEVKKENESVVYPVVENGGDRVEKNWHRGHNRVSSELEEYRIRRDAGGKISIDFKTRIDENSMPVTWWDNNEYASANYGASELKGLFGEISFDFPKALNLVMDCLKATNAMEESVILDFFPGSGTTGHAAINLNREDAGKRKYILVEMGNHFDTVLKPRLQKVVFSKDWRDGVPQQKSNPEDPNNHYNGVSHCIKILRLESYEDALDNIQFDSAAAPGEALGLDFNRDYELQYALDWESRNSPTRLAVDAMETPFDYTITLRRETGTATVKPDLTETFAYLIGLHVRRRFWTEREGHRYLVFTGTLHADGTEVAILWRTCRAWPEAELQKEKDWWREQRETLAPGASRVYVNAASAIDGHLCLDLEFKRRMHPASDNG